MSTDEDKIKIFLAAGMSQEKAKSIVELLNTADKEKELKEAYEKLPSVDTEKWHEVGEVGVDAGMVWIGDPCYIMKMPHHEGAQEDPLPTTLGKTWHDFCDIMHQYETPQEFYEKHLKLGHKWMDKAVQFNYEAGHPGLGVCMASGYGDGSYPVYVRYNSEGRIAEARIVFISDESDEDE